MSVENTTVITEAESTKFLSITSTDSWLLSGLLSTSLYFSSIEAGGQSVYRLSKFTDIYEKNNNASARPTSLILGINLIRLPEMYYIAAESLLDTDYDRALAYYDEVIVSRGLEPLSATDAKLTQEIINTERYKEYFGEGQTFFNMKRQNQNIVSYDNKITFTPVDGIYNIPIPDIEKDNRN